MKFLRPIECFGAVLGIALLWCAAAVAQPANNGLGPTADVTLASANTPVSTHTAPPPVAPSNASSTTQASSARIQREKDRAALKAPKESQFRPTGPVKVTADRAELVQGNYAIYSGQVVLSSNTMDMAGDRLELRQQAGGQFIATLTGNPATMSHPSSGPQDPPVTARAMHMVYDSASQQLTLTDDAKLTRGKNVVEGKTIHYDALSHHVQASGGKNGQVHMIILPPPPANTPPHSP